MNNWNSGAENGKDSIGDCTGAALEMQSSIPY